MFIWISLFSIAMDNGIAKPEDCDHDVQIHRMVWLSAHGKMEMGKNVMFLQMSPMKSIMLYNHSELLIDEA